MPNSSATSDPGFALCRQYSTASCLKFLLKRLRGARFGISGRFMAVTPFCWLTCVRQIEATSREDAKVLEVEVVKVLQERSRVVLAGLELSGLREGLVVASG